MSYVGSGRDRPLLHGGIDDSAGAGPGAAEGSQGGPRGEGRSRETRRTPAPTPGAQSKHCKQSRHYVMMTSSSIAAANEGEVYTKTGALGDIQ